MPMDFPVTSHMPPGAEITVPKPRLKGTVAAEVASIEQRTKTLTAGTTSYDLDADLVDILSAVLFTANDTTVDKQLERLNRAEELIDNL